MIRCFAAIELPASLRKELELIQIGLPAGRLIDPENLHLTMVFLGELPANVVEDVDLAFKNVHRDGFELQPEGLGIFGGAKPRYVYAGFREEPGLSVLQAKLANAARNAGAKPDKRRFVPHVTLAKLHPDETDKSRLERFVAERSGNIGAPFRVESFQLYRSYLRKSGSIYQEMARYPLDPSAPTGTVRAAISRRS